MTRQRETDIGAGRQPTLPVRALSSVPAAQAVAVSPWGQLALAYTDDNDDNSFDQVILGLGASNSDW
ncbi:MULTISPECIES: hypothetical protein [Protofrankia]|uniref:hypothetical protein n=1 Tax=Protofrankia TaxID=2994361 RepID=UPI0001C534DF|nr:MULTISPECIES: hypothetical protein [Protofrankia]